MKQKEIEVYLRVAHTFASLSYCKRLQVGAVLVKDRQIISHGYNGTPPGWENVCEDENGKTHPYVIHAEINAIIKVARSNVTTEGSSLFITHAPCINCANIIAAAGIKEVYYEQDYRCSGGIELLKRHKIHIVKVNLD